MFVSYVYRLYNYLIDIKLTFCPIQISDPHSPNLFYRSPDELVLALPKNCNAAWCKDVWPNTFLRWNPVKILPFLQHIWGYNVCSNFIQYKFNKTKVYALKNYRFWVGLSAICFYKIAQINICPRRHRNQESDTFRNKANFLIRA